MLAAAGVALGVVLGKIGVSFQNHSEMAKVAQFDIEGWRKRLADAEIEVRSNEDALLLLNRVSAINNKLREEGLEPLKVNKDLLAQLGAAEDRLRFSTEEGTEALQRRISAQEKFLEQLEERAFRTRLEGLSDIDRLRARTDREVEQLERRARELNLPTGAIEGGIGDIRMQETLRFIDMIQRARDEIEKLSAVELEGIEKVIAERERKITKVHELASLSVALRQDQADAEVRIMREAEREIIEIRRREFEQAEELVRNLERQAELAQARDPFERINLERLEKLREIDDNIKLSQSQVERARVAVNREASGQIQDENERLFNEQQRLQERNFREYDRFLDRMVRFTEQSGNFLTNIWRTVADEFQRSVTKMVLSWIFGLRQIGAATGGGRAGAGGGTGILGGLFGGLLGLPQTGSARTPDFNPAGSSFVFGAVQGVGVPSTATPAGTAAGAGQGGLGGLLSQIPGGQGALLGALLGISVGSQGRPIGGLLAGLGGTLGGVALSGAAAGSAGGIGALAGSGAALAGFLTNPIGLAILGGIGATSFLVGVLSRGKKKRQASDVANRGFDEIGQVVKAFELRQLDFLRANDQMQQVWDQMVEGWQRIGGKVGRRSIATQRPFFDQALARIEEIQRERNRRGDLIGGLPIPEFASGGLVPGAGQRPILAAVHPGEFVLNRDAVSRIGQPRLESANKGSGSGGITVVIQTPDKHGVEEMLRGNAAAFERVIVKTVHQNVRDGGPMGALA